MYGLEYAAYLCYMMLAGLSVDVGVKVFKGSKKMATSKIGGKKDLKDLTGEGIQISKDYRLSRKLSMEHICIIAPTGAGKTVNTFFPNLLQPIKGSLIVADPKEELYQKTHKYQESLGKRTILFNPLKGSIQYNPLDNCRNNREVFQLSQNLLINGALSYKIATGSPQGGTEWLQMAQSLLAASLLYSKTIPDALNLILNKNSEELDDIFTHSNEAIRTQYNSFKQCLESPKTMSSIKITLTSNLNLFTDNLKINKTDFTAEEIRKKPTVLYISYPENKSTYLAPFMACFYSQLIDHLIDNYNPQSLDVYMLLDEFANIGMISNMSQNISTSRSRKVSFTICLQSMTQLIQNYGKENALSILNDCKTKIILPGISDPETLKYCSELCGEEQIIVMQNDKPVKMKKQLFTYDEIRRLDDEKLLIICNNRLPIVSKQNIYYKNSKYKEAII